MNPDLAALKSHILSCAWHLSTMRSSCECALKPAGFPSDVGQTSLASVGFLHWKPSLWEETGLCVDGVTKTKLGVGSELASRSLPGTQFGAM